MPRWSHAMKLSHYESFEHDLQRPGVYEIGHVQAGIFYPKYVGKAENRLIDRIKTYGAHFGRGSHNGVIRTLSPAQFAQLYFHVMARDGPGRAAIREALLLIRHQYGEATPYPWNAKYELQVLRDAGYAIRDVKVRSR